MTDFSLPSATHCSSVGLLVADLDPVVDFYRDVVGLSVLSRTPERLTLGVDDPLIELVEDPSAPPRTRSEAGLFHVAVRVPSRAALGDALGRIRDRWRLAGASDHLVSEALYLRDPEGNGVEVYRDRPHGEWPHGADGSVQMDTLSLDLDELAADADGESVAPAGTDVGHVHLEVSSLDGTSDFFIDALGLNRRQVWGDSALFVAAGDYHHHVGLNVWNGRSTPRTGRGLLWFSLAVPDEATLEALTARLDRAERVGGELVVPLRDPSGVDLRVCVAADA